MPALSPPAAARADPGDAASFWRSPVGVLAVLLAVAASLYLYLAQHADAWALLAYLSLGTRPALRLLVRRGPGQGEARTPGTPPERNNLRSS